MSLFMRIYCCCCLEDTTAILIFGEQAYPHRKDLKTIPFWQCPKCKSFVGCHHKTKDRLRPLGVIPSQEIKELRKDIHRLLDPLWRPNNRKKRKQIYQAISTALGYEFHSGEIREADEAHKVLEFLKENLKELKGVL